MKARLDFCALSGLLQQSQGGHSGHHHCPVRQGRLSVAAVTHAAASQQAGKQSGPPLPQHPGLAPEQVGKLHDPSLCPVELFPCSDFIIQVQILCRVLLDKRAVWRPLEPLAPQHWPAGRPFPLPRDGCHTRGAMSLGGQLTRTNLETS